MNRGFDVLDKSRGTLILSGFVPVMSPYVLRLHCSKGFTTVHLNYFLSLSLSLSLSKKKKLVRKDQRARETVEEMVRIEISLS